MNPIDLIFRILRENALMNDKDFAKYNDEAAKWWSEIRIDDYPELVKDWKYYLKLYSSKWYIAVGIAVMYFPIKRWLMDYVSDAGQYEEYQD